MSALYKAATHMDNLGNHALAHELRTRHVQNVNLAVSACKSAEETARRTPTDWKRANRK